MKERRINRVEILDWFFIILLSLAILVLICAIFQFLSSVSKNKKIKDLKKLHSKNKRKRKKMMIQRKKLENQQKKERTRTIIFLLMGVLAIGAAFYSRYYQSMNLSEKDSTAVVQGYLLNTEIERQLASLDKEENVEKSKKNIQELSARLASYGARRADGRLSKDGQLMLNQLYKNMKELGLNLSNQSLDSLKESETLASYQEDIKKIQVNQKNVFTYFHIDESALKEKK